MTVRLSAFIVVAAAAASLAACGSHHFTGHSGTCTYGLKGYRDGGNHCYRRPSPSDELTAKAMSGVPLRRGIATWVRGGGSRTIGSIGVDKWAETTFAYEPAGGGRKFVSFDVQGRLTGGNEGYAAAPRDEFPVSAARPAVFRRTLAHIRARQPSARLIGGVIDVAPFSHMLAWNLDIGTKGSGSTIAYEARADGSGLCHAEDHNANDNLLPAPGIPACDHSVLPLGLGHSSRSSGG
jgi:hypothetical protein